MLIAMASLDTVASAMIIIASAAVAVVPAG